MAVAMKIISGNDQPSGGRAITSIAGARGLTSAQIINSKHTQEPFLSSPVPSSVIDQPIADIDGKLNTRWQNPDPSWCCS
jgi:hypothetical protein|tara:strand:- start:2324 stop:2563 length:240 start_codon:yes stop_codon:yes gene_type:complete